MSNKRYCVIDCENQPAWEPIRFGEMFRSKLQTLEESEEESWRTCNIALGDSLPDDILDFQGVIISGSHFNCRDQESIPWFESLRSFIRKAAEKGSPRVGGICFGCQIIADSLGGEVDFNPSHRFVLKAEHISLQQYAHDSEAFQLIQSTSPIPDRWFTTGFSLLVSHGDCVRKLPPNAQLLATSPTCQAELYLAGRGYNMIACQGHPEFDLQYAIYDRIWKAVVERNKRLNEEEILIAQDSFAHYEKTDAIEFMHWLKTFLSVPPSLPSATI